MKLQNLLSSEEQIIWKGTPDVPVLALQNLFTYYIPGITFIFFFLQCMFEADIHPVITTLNTYIKKMDFLQFLFAIFGIALLCFPFVRAYHMKHIVYVFTNTRAFSFNSKTNEIEFEVPATDILSLTRREHSDGRISLQFWKQYKSNQPDEHTIFSKVGFEYIPSHILDYYKK